MKLVSSAIGMLLGAAISFHVLATPSETNQQLQQNLLATQSEVIQLKATLQVVQSYQDKFLATVYWSLGTIATIVVLLVGFGWFANFRIYERDKSALKDELHMIMNEELLQLRKIVETHVTDSTKSIERQIDEATKASCYL